MARSLLFLMLKTTFAYWSFSVMGPRLWNELSTEIRSELNIDIFKKTLKTHVFRRAFNMDLIYYQTLRADLIL